MVMCSYCDLFFQEENLNRCSISADSRIENSGTEDSTDDENLDMKDNGYHDAENEVDPETDDDPERVHSGKLSESSGSAGSDLYDYKVLSLSLSKTTHADMQATLIREAQILKYVYAYRYLLYSCMHLYIHVETSNEHLIAILCSVMSSMVLPLLLQV